MEHAKKDFQGKPDLGLVVRDFSHALKELAHCATFGAQKYGRHNWRLHGELDDKYISAALRHIFAHLEGERDDPESSRAHLAHAVWSLLACLQKNITDELTKNR